MTCRDCSKYVWQAKNSLQDLRRATWRVQTKDTPAARAELEKRRLAYVDHVKTQAEHALSHTD